MGQKTRLDCDARLRSKICLHRAQMSWRLICRALPDVQQTPGFIARLESPLPKMAAFSSATTATELSGESTTPDNTSPRLVSGMTRAVLFSAAPDVKLVAD